MLRLNPGDNHGLRYRLAMSYLESGDNDACASLATACPDDIRPELRFNEALALHRLGKAKSAGDALRRAGEMSRRGLRYLLPGRIRKPKMGSMGASFDGDDRAWLYRQSMRPVWTETPGALDWAKKVLAGS